MTDSRPAVVVVLAAGQGTRMKSATAKVLHDHRAAARLLGHVLAAVEPLEPSTPSSSSATAATRSIAAPGEDRPDGAKPVVQDEQNGTGHAVRLALDAAGERRRQPSSSSPATRRCCTAETLEALLAGTTRRAPRPPCSPRVMPDPTGYGRIVRDPDGARDGASSSRRTPTTRIRADPRGRHQRLRLRRRQLRASLARLTTDNAQGEEYLTDVIGLLVADGALGRGRVADDRRRDAGRQRPGAARRGPAAQRDRIVEQLDARRRHRHRPGRRPGSTSSVDARARRRRCCRTPSCTAARTIARRRHRRARTAR